MKFKKSLVNCSKYPGSFKKKIIIIIKGIILNFTCLLEWASTLHFKSNASFDNLFKFLRALSPFFLQLYIFRKQKFQAIAISFSVRNESWFFWNKFDEIVQSQFLISTLNCLKSLRWLCFWNKLFYLLCELYLCCTVAIS